MTNLLFIDCRLAMKRRLRLPTLTAEFFNLPVIVGVAMQVLPSRQTVFSHRLTYAACLVLALHMGVTLPATAVAAAGKGGGGAGGLGQNFWTANPATQGGDGGGLDPITSDGKAGAGANAAHSPGTGGAAPKAASSNDVVTTDVSGSRGTCAAPCDNNHGGGGGGVAILGGENINLVIATNVSVTGGNGAAGSPGGADALQNMAYVGGGGGGGAGIAAVSGVLTLNGPVSGGMGGASRGHPGAGGDAVVLTRGDIIINALVSGGQGGTRDLNLAPARSREMAASASPSARARWSTTTSCWAVFPAPCSTQTKEVSAREAPRYERAAIRPSPTRQLQQQRRDCRSLRRRQQHIHHVVGFRHHR